MVQRYEILDDDFEEAKMIPNNNGRYVSYEDHSELVDKYNYIAQRIIDLYKDI